MGSTLEILKRLCEQGVDFVVVGGLAGVAHGSSLVTEDLDVCTPMSSQNLSRILAALADLSPRWRMLPARPPLPLEPSKLESFKNLYILTDWGQVDFLSEIAGIGDYEKVSQHCVTLDISGASCRVLSLDALIEAKRAFGRPKDVQAAVELEAIRDRSRQD